MGDFRERNRTPEITYGGTCVFRYGSVKDHSVNGHRLLLLSTGMNNEMVVPIHLNRNERTFGVDLSLRRGLN